MDSNLAESKSCGKCTNVCKTDSLDCSMCGVWFHQRCVKLTNLKYKYIISSDKDMFWLCEVCRKRPWHFCICFQFIRVNKPGHNCQHLHNDIGYLNLDVETKPNREEIICSVSVEENSSEKTDNGFQLSITKSNINISEVDNSLSNITAVTETDPGVSLEDTDPLSNISEDTGRAFLLPVEEQPNLVTGPKPNVEEGCIKTQSQETEKVAENNNTKGNITSLDSKNTCTKCGRNFKFHKCLISHLKSHDKQYNCHLCSKVSKSEGNLRFHIRIVHLKDKRFVCSICNMKFETPKRLREHSEIHIPKEERKVYQCKVCKKRLTCKYYFDKHVSTNCFTTRIRRESKKYECDQCGKKLCSKSWLKQHKNLHDGILEFKCKECGKAYPTQSGLYNHEETFHKERPVCHYCGRSFATKRVMENHIIKVHHNEPSSFLCDNCGLAFKTKGHLKRHSYMHSEERPFGCEVCGRRFNYDIGLRNHMLDHMKKMYECSECHKSYTRNSSLLIHMKTHTGVQSYGCTKCGKRFTQLDSYVHHMKVCKMGN